MMMMTTKTTTKAAASNDNGDNNFQTSKWSLLSLSLYFSVCVFDLMVFLLLFCDAIKIKYNLDITCKFCYFFGIFLFSFHFLSFVYFPNFFFSCVALVQTKLAFGTIIFCFTTFIHIYLLAMQSQQHPNSIKCKCTLKNHRQKLKCRKTKGTKKKTAS